MFTEQQVIDAGILLGMDETKSLEFFDHYNAQGWLYPYQLPITNLRSAMRRWQRNSYKFENGNKTKLRPIPGKNCYKCRMPAVYIDKSGSYDEPLCSKHLPAKVKEKFQ